MSDFDLGRHEEAITALRLDFTEMRGTVRSMDSKLDLILTQQAEKRGERKVIAALATAAGGVGSLLISLLLKLWGGAS